MGKGARAVRERWCRWCDQAHNMTSLEIMAHHHVKFEQKLADDTSKQLMKELKERKSGETGSD